MDEFVDSQACYNAVLILFQKRWRGFVDDKVDKDLVSDLDYYE